MASKTPNAPLGIEEMFQQIMIGMQKSNQEVSELRNECAELRQANAALEKQIRESLTGGLAPPSRQGSFFHSPTVPGSPIARPTRSPFLAPTGAPSLYVPSTPSQETKSLECPAFGLLFLPEEPERVSGLFLANPTPNSSSTSHSPAVPSSRAHGTVSCRSQLPSVSWSSPAKSMLRPSKSNCPISIPAVLARRDPDAVLGSFAADHMISGADAFMAAVTEAVATARHDYLVTIGIAPSHPSTGFGYFKEKPDARTAAAYITSGNYRWNAGAQGKGSRRDLANLPKIAIDNAVAEPAALTGRVATVPATFGWDDVGDFASLSDLLPAEHSQTGFWVTETWVAGGIVVPASGRLIACLGVDDLVVVDTNDALLITTRARSQEVKKIVQKTKESGWKQLL
ncbi:mannose-1-phosphate guanylyltransferase [Rhizoctonia solani]|uniref:Mannose-1-phosphate guanylyltransferase n=1 Tax=Rhizoctonia solani TaxID=456999 RepID=A0A8H8T378_9AGAM|nr:mannose-1-phosphate guanylyltransferase [Rhizoctonia solani]QRW27599.1 mannose-1-phosphate guanylyltransferase [Rhizoctonia solani]